MSTLGDVGAKRGYLLPYHKMLAEHEPELLSAYDRFYTQLTLADNILSRRDKEIVWIALLAAAREGVGSLHLKRGVEAGLSLEEIQASAALAAVTEAFAATAFAARHWAEWTPTEAMTSAYRALAEAARGPIEPHTAELAMTVCHASRKDEGGMRHHLLRYFELGGTAAALCEGLSFLFIPIGGNMLIDAVEIWDRAAAELGFPGPFPREPA